jgi:hypothetical protein
MGKPVKQRAVLLREGFDPEYGLVNRLASVQGLKLATALKMHLRETLPAKVIKLEKESQQKTRRGQHVA